MARKATHPPLSVFLNGLAVGTLRRAATGAVSFQYAEPWLNNPQAQPVSLSLPLRESRYTGAPVMAVFDNLLPDQESIRRRVAERVGADGTDAFSLLSAIGRDCVGALQFLAQDTYPDPPGTVQAEPINDDGVAALLDNLASSPLGLSDDGAFRISLAGAQEKTALLWHQGRWQRPAGTTATTHIFKPAIGRLPNSMDLSQSVENEFLCLKLLGALGLPVARAVMSEFGHDLGWRRVLVVERFDRRWTADGRLLRLPQEDCCQALGVPPTRKYQTEGGPGLRDILTLLAGSDDPQGDQRIVLKAAMVFWLLAATDGHAKNFGLMLGSGGRFRLAPLYDVMSLQPVAAAGGLSRRDLKLAMSAGTNRHYRVDDLHLRHFIQTAAAANIGRSVVEACFAELVDGMDGALESVTGLGLPDPLVAAVSDGIRSRLATAKA